MKGQRNVSFQPRTGTDVHGKQVLISIPVTREAVVDRVNKVLAGDRQRVFRDGERYVLVSQRRESNAPRHCRSERVVPDMPAMSGKQWDSAQWDQFGCDNSPEEIELAKRRLGDDHPNNQSAMRSCPSMIRTDTSRQTPASAAKNIDVLSLASMPEHSCSRSAPKGKARFPCLRRAQKLQHTILDTVTNQAPARAWSRKVELLI